MRRLSMYLVVAFVAFFIGLFVYELRCPMVQVMVIKDDGTRTCVARKCGRLWVY